MELILFGASSSQILDPFHENGTLDNPISRLTRCQCHSSYVHHQSRECSTNNKMNKKSTTSTLGVYRPGLMRRSQITFSKGSLDVESRPIPDCSNEYWNRYHDIEMSESKGKTTSWQSLEECHHHHHRRRRRRHRSDSSLVQPISDGLASQRIHVCSHDKLGGDVKRDNLVRDRVSQSRDENSHQRSRPISHKGQKESWRKSSLSTCLLLQYWWIQQWYLTFCHWILPPRIGSTLTFRHSTASWRNLGPWMVVILFIISLLSSCAIASHADLLSLPSSLEANEPSREKVCQSVDIRNSVENLRELEDCTVVEGFVHIVLIEKASAGVEFLNHTYPKLREITGYLLLYRAFGLRSLRQLFPNLAVIRGQMLIFNHALVIYEMMQLQEIGLTSLTDIQRGGVLIEKNPNLCFVHSIDWDRIAKEGRGSNFITENKPIKDCPLCPTHCPSAADGRKLCWTNDDCQKVCDECGNRTCIVNYNKDHLTTKTSVSCCHEECLGGCNGTENDQCHVCKHVVHKNVCRASCPPSTFLYMKRRCVTDTECIQLPPPKEKLLTEKKSSLNWKPFGKECVLDCPPGFQQTQERSRNGTMYYTCKECQGPCPKSCPANLVSNIETAQQLKGCTKITGNLGIQIKGGNNIVRELEENLGGIEEIDGSLKIARSYSLLSLNFLKSLKVIHGKTLEKEEYAVYVLDNENLQELWNWDRRTNDLVIERGKIFFHFNPKLCLHQIEKLNEKTKDKNYTELDVSPTSNGDKAACNEQTLAVNISKVGALSIAISWENYKKQLTDPRALLGYVISYIEAPHKNVTFYDGRDACGGDGWKVNDVTASDNNLEFYLIPHLKPFTQYALYVRTYTVAAEVSKRVGARSQILYVRTLPDEPDKPDNLIAYANSSSELVVEWKPPKNQNGIVTHYIVYGIWRTDEQEYVDKQDFCQDVSISVSDTKKSGSENRTVVVPTGPLPGSSEVDPSGQQCCSCLPQDNLPLKEIEKEQQFRIKFENHLHNAIYVKQSDQNFLENQTSRLPKGRRVKREGNAFDNTTGLDIFKEFPDEIEIHPKSVAETNDTLTNTYFRDRLRSFKQEVNDTRVTIRQLRHFAEYTIKVEACHDPEPGKPKRCSKSVVASARTKQLEQADDVILPIRVETFNQTIGSVKISWQEPSDPNGLVLKYRLEYKRIDIENVEPQALCIRRKDFIDNNKTKILRDLAPGNYSIRVRSHSLAGPGRYTPFVYFYVQQPSSSIGPGTIAGIFVLVFLLCVALGGIATYYVVKRKMSVSNAILYASVNPDYMSTAGVYIPDDWEVARENVKLDRELGQGSFGTVYEGIVRNVVKGQPEAKCAVKTVNECASIAERIQFLNEASVMKEFNTHHVVKLLGVVSKGQPTLVIMELMANGDLKTYLRSHRPDCEENISEGRQPPTLKCILKMAIEIADGMAYLAEKKFIHRDLAARNCMVAEDLTVKIGDFGMTRDIYETDYYRKGGKGLLPVRWMAPESLRDGVFTTQCDVWSYGVVLWEMATLASQPYQGLSNEQVLKYVMDGGVMEKPEGCPDRLYQLMEMCWRYQPKHRPTFLDIIEDLLPDVPVQFASVSFFHTDSGVAARAAQRNQQEQEYRVLQDPSTPLKSALDCPEAGISTSSPVDNKDTSSHRYRGDQVLSIDDDDLSESGEQATGNSDVVGRNPHQEDLDDDDDDEEEFRSNHDPEDDHVPVIFPNDKRPYILIRDPTHAVSNGSKSDSSKGTTIPSEDSKGSYVSNGSASNGYVMGILKQRRHNSAEC